MKTLRINPIHLLIGMALPIVVLVLLLYLGRYLWIVGMYLAPVLIIAALIINRKAVLGFVKTLGDTFWRNPIKGILYCALMLIGFPLVAAYILFQAVFQKKLSEMQAQMQSGNADPFSFFGGLPQQKKQQPKSDDTEFADYEEIK